MGLQAHEYERTTNKALAVGLSTSARPHTQSPTSKL
jgi:hypothetical protein